MIKSVLGVVLNIVSISCLVTIIIIFSATEGTETYNDTNHHLLLIFILVCAGLGRVYLSLPYTLTLSNNYRQVSSIFTQSLHLFIITVTTYINASLHNHISSHQIADLHHHFV